MVHFRARRLPCSMRLRPVAMLFVTLVGPMTHGQSSGDSGACDGVFALTDVQQEPQFTGGVSAMYEYLTQNLRYPDLAYEQDIQGRVYVGFVVDKTGKVKDVTVAKGVHALLDSEAVRVITTMPAWTPGMKACGTVDCQYTLPVNFKVHTLSTTRSSATVDSVLAGDELFDLATVGVPPEFVGGVEGMYQWMADHQRYPDFAFENGIQGTVLIQFTVEKTGMIMDPHVERGVHATLDADALRLVRSMPPWSPGYLNGKAVRCRFNLPIVYKLRGVR